MYHVVFSQMLISFALLAIVTAQFGPHGPHHGNPHFGPPGHRHRLLSAQRHSQLLQHALFISTPRPNRLQFGQPGVGFPRRPISAPIPTTTSSPVPPSSTQSPVQLNSVSPRPRPVTNNNLGGRKHFYSSLRLFTASS